MVGVVVGVLLENRIRGEEKKEVKAENLQLLANRVTSQLIGLLTHIGMNQAKLSPILAENLEGKSPSKADFRSMIDNALSAYPFPDPSDIQLSREDPSGYGILMVSAQISQYVKEANTAAAESRANGQDVKYASNFLAMNDRIVAKAYILETAEAQFKAYLETLQDIFGRKFKPEEKDAAVKKMVNDLEKSYSIAVEMGEALDGYRKTAGDYLRKIGW